MEQYGSGRNDSCVKMQIIFNGFRNDYQHSKWPTASRADKHPVIILLYMICIIYPLTTNRKALSPVNAQCKG